MDTIKLGDGEYRFACIIWEQEPIASGELVKLCEKELGWKKSTVYTVLKKLCEKGIFKNEQAMVSSCIPKEQVQKQESKEFVSTKFQGSLPKFIAAFIKDETISEQEAEEIKQMIDKHREG